MDASQVLRSSVAALAALGTVVAVLPASAAPPKANTIAVDATAVRGFVQPAVSGQMMEWAEPSMNQAWAEQARGRSFEQDTVTRQSSPLYDAFSGSTLDRSLWTPLSLDAAPHGSVNVSSSELAITAASPGRFGVMSNDVHESHRAGYSVETRVNAYTGTNALLTLYGGTGAGDHSNYVEFGLEGGNLTVFADGEPTWTGPTATAPATLRIDVAPLADGTRDLRFFHDGTLVHSMTAFSLLPSPFRVFLYGWDGTVTYEYVTMDRDDTFDDFNDSSLSNVDADVARRDQCRNDLPVGRDAADRRSSRQSVRRPLRARAQFRHRLDDRVGDPYAVLGYQRASEHLRRGRRG
jgi:hypothetical protein